MQRSQCKTISAKVLEALTLIEDELGVTFSQGNGTFDESSFTMKLIATSNAADGSSQSKEELDFLSLASRYGLSKEDLGRTFQSNGKTFKLVGCKPRNTKYPLIAQGIQGGRYKMTAMQVRSGLGRSTIHTI